MIPKQQGSNGQLEIPATTTGGDAHPQPSKAWQYLLFILVSVCVVLAFALFQHLVVLDISLENIRPGQLIIPTVVGGLFGYLLARNRVLQQRSASQLKTIMQRDHLLEQEISERKLVESRLRDKKTRLEATNAELKSFSYSVSHDLRSPLRAIHGFSQALDEEYRSSLDQEAQHYLDRMQSGCQRMEEMIDSLLVLSRVTQSDIVSTEVDLSAIAEDLLDELAERCPERHVATEIEAGLVAWGDRNLLAVVMENLIGNAWKYTSKTADAAIRFRSAKLEGKQVFCVEDNGVGFNDEYADRLFTAFSRLHHHNEFPGSGIGLATVQRALLRQGGMIRAQGKEGEGARFCFSV